MTPTQPHPDTLTNTLQRLPGPDAPARPTAPLAIYHRLSTPLLDCFGYRREQLVDDSPAVTVELAIPETQHRGTVTVIPPSQWQQVRHVSPGESSLWSPHDGQFSFVTDGYDWAVAVTPGDGIKRIADVSLADCWSRCHRPATTAGYLTTTRCQAAHQEILEYLAASQLTRRLAGSNTVE